MAILLVIAGGLVVYFLNADRELTADQVTELIELKNTGIGYLEAGEYDASDRVFTDIIERLPDDPLGIRNLTITRVLALKENTLSDPQVGIDAAHEALGRLQDLV